ncbi:sigma-70 family RNA polymerase sigma factor [Micromonospora fluostatini]|uniref:Sigma-70 family RNA polymerase sigma factor n=1 Tax=Micromonospora fluostatini TaxID=1629071 RepID=A0ABY2DH11_9ACTN|nr:sigma-70 family RNA polymerase sigma factor [Micromonospora fluostatini]
MGEPENVLVPAVAPPRVDHPPAVPAGFVAFYRERYRELVRVAMYFGAAEPEAYDAVAAATLEVLIRWDDINNPYQYARTAAISNFVKYRTRGGHRPRHRQAEAGRSTPDGTDPPPNTSAEDRQDVIRLLAQLPHPQRQVMALTVDGYGSAEIANQLDQTPSRVRELRQTARQNLSELLAARDPQDDWRSLFGAGRLTAGTETR